MRPLANKPHTGDIRIGMKNYSHWLLIHDFRQYIKRDKEIEEWMSEHGCFLEGMFIVFPDEETKTLFTLRWC